MRRAFIQFNRDVRPARIPKKNIIFIKGKIVFSHQTKFESDMQTKYVSMNVES